MNYSARPIPVYQPREDLRDDELAMIQSRQPRKPHLAEKPKNQELEKEKEFDAAFEI